MDTYTKEEIDALHHEMTTSVTTELQGMQSVQNARNKEIQDSIDTLSAKIDGLMEFMKNVNFGIKGVKISWHVIVGVGGFIAAIAAIIVFFKFVLAGIISWALSKT